MPKKPEPEPEPPIRIGKFLVLVVIVIIGLPILFMSITVVPAGQVGVYDVFGNVREGELTSGLHFKEFYAGIHKMSIKTQEYTMSIAKGEGAKHGDDSITAITQEGLTVALDITVLYSLKPAFASDVYKTVGMDYISVIVRPQIRTVIREVVAKYEAKQLYSADREAVALEITERLEPELISRGIFLEKVLLRNIKLPAELTTSIERKLVAEQEAQQMVFVLEKEGLEAQRKEIEAVGIKNATLIVQQGLERSPEYLTYLWLQKLENHDSVVYLMDGDMGLPIFKDIDK